MKTQVEQPVQILAKSTDSLSMKDLKENASIESFKALKDQSHESLKLKGQAKM